MTTLTRHIAEYLDGHDQSVLDSIVGLTSQYDAMRLMERVRLGATFSACINAETGTQTISDNVEPYSDDGYSEDGYITFPDGDYADYVWCDSYDFWFHYEYSYSTANGDVISQRVYNEDYFTCGDCNDVLPNNESHSDDCESYCETCYYDNGHAENDDDDGGQVHCYSANVLNIIGQTALVNNERKRLSLCDGVDLFGVELETATQRSQSRGEVAEQLYNDVEFYQFGILKEDSTVSGPELCMLPANLEAHRKQIPWPDICESLRGTCRGYGRASVGMHVHVSRAPLSDFVTGKILVFMNLSRNTNFIEQIAQREHNQWCSASEKKITDGKRRFGEKYEIVHLTDQTIEFRIFQSNLLEARILKNIEFCAAVVQFCRDTSMRRLTVAEFLNWLVVENKDNYPALFHFIKTRRLA